MGENPAPPLLFAPSESAALAAGIAVRAGLSLAPLEERAFEDGEFKLRPACSVRGRRVFVAQTLASGGGADSARRLVRLLFLLHVLRDGGAHGLTAVIPYLAYARKERRTQPRDPVTTRYVAQQLEAAGMTHAMLLDAHDPASVDNALRVPLDHLSALPSFAAQIAARAGTAQVAVASPDVGGIKRAQRLRELLQGRLGRPVRLIFIEKRRALGVVSGGTVIGDPRDCTVVIVDDLCATGGTLVRAAAALAAGGAAAVLAAVTHAPLAAGLERLRGCADIQHLLVTDSVGTALRVESDAGVTVLPVATVLGEAVGRIARREPLAPLLDQAP